MSEIPFQVIGELELLTADDVAALIKTDASTVYRMMRAGEIQTVRFGRLRRVRKCDLERFICEHSGEGERETS